MMFDRFSCVHRGVFSSLAHILMLTIINNLCASVALHVMCDEGGSWWHVVHLYSLVHVKAFTIVNVSSLYLYNVCLPVTGAQSTWSLVYAVISGDVEQYI